jgi:hypothetical protein
MFLPFVPAPTLAGANLLKKKPAIDWQSRVFGNLLSLAYYPEPTMSNARTQRCQMDVCPLTRIGFCPLVNAVFIFDRA